MGSASQTNCSCFATYWVLGLIKGASSGPRTRTKSLGLGYEAAKLLVVFWLLLKQKFGSRRLLSFAEHEQTEDLLAPGPASSKSHSAAKVVLGTMRQPSFARRRLALGCL